MAKWICLNEVLIGAQAGGPIVKVFPGETIDDTQQSTAPMIAAGAILWPATDPIVAGAANITNNLLKLRGQGQSAKLSDALLAAALYSMLGGSGGQALGPAFSGAGQLGAIIQKATLAVGFAQLTAAAATQALNLAPSVPVNARVVGRSLRIATAFSGGAISGMTVSVGNATEPTAVINGQTVFTGTTGNIQGTTGPDPNMLVATAIPFQILFTAAGANVNAATAGALVIDVLYVVLP